MIEEGSVIGPYLVQDRIGQGASAIVHRGWHDDLQRTVAIKFLPPLHNPLAMARFVREARALRRLDHPNIVEVMETGEFEGTPFMVFDFIPAGSLAEHMAMEPIPSADAMAILNGIAKGLDHAHKHGIIHRDVKPANVLLNSSGAPVLADFGLARLLEQPSATAAGMFAGTPAYMSPEQAEGGDVGPRADQYSLAALAYELLTGQVPFPGDTVSVVLTALLTRDPAKPSSVRPGLSAAVDRAILRGLSKAPEDRWPNCQSLIDAILTAMVGWVPERPVALVPTTHHIPSTGTDPRIAALDFGPSEPYLTIVMPYSQAQPRNKARRRLLAAVAAALVLGTVAVGAAWSGSLGDLTGSHPAAASGAAASSH